MPVTVPVSNQSSMQFSNPSSSLVTPSLVTSSLTDPRLLSPQQPALQRNSVSPGLPQRPASAGKWAGGESLKWKLCVEGALGFYFQWRVFPLQHFCMYRTLEGKWPRTPQSPLFLSSPQDKAHGSSAFLPGAMLGGDLNSANGACPSPVGECSCLRRVAQTRDLMEREEDDRAKAGCIRGL